MWAACSTRRTSSRSLELTQLPQIRQYAHYNRGHAIAQLVIWVLIADERLDVDFFPRGWLEMAIVDLREAAALNEQDAAAWAWIGMASLLLGSLTELPVRERIRHYRQAVSAYETGLVHEGDPRERAIMQANLGHARRGVELLDSVNWISKRWGTSKRTAFELPTALGDDPPHDNWLGLLRDMAAAGRLDSHG